MFIFICVYVFIYTQWQSQSAAEANSVHGFQQVTQVWYLSGYKGLQDAFLGHRGKIIFGEAIWTDRKRPHKSINNNTTTVFCVYMCSRKMHANVNKTH